MTASRPARAMRGAGVVLAVLIACRVPAIERDFVAALTAAEREAPRRLPALGHGPGGGTPRAPTTVLAAAVPQPIHDARPASPTVVVPVVAAGRRVQVAIATPVARGVPSIPEPIAAEAAGGEPAVAAPASAATPSGAAAGDPFALATAAYVRLAAGDRRGAVRLFDAALAGPGVDGADGWRRQRDALVRRWSGSAYSIVRGSGPAGLAVEPVLGGGQSGGGIAYSPDPLDRRPLALTVRGSVAHDDAGRSGFAAVGVQWHPLAGVTLAAERLIAVGPAARGDWTVRLAGGFDRSRGRFRLTGYGEGGFIGRATYAALQGRVAATVHDGGVAFDPGAGVWASIQRDAGTTVDRVELGPGVIARAAGLAVEVDYRFRVAGGAAPGSGPVLTLSTAF